MADNPQTRTYEGPIAHGTVKTPGGPVKFTRGVPVEVTDEQAAALDDDWTAPKSPNKPKGDKPEPKES